jgi:hypothetical protein
MSAEASPRVFLRLPYDRRAVIAVVPDGVADSDWETVAPAQTLQLGRGVTPVMAQKHLGAARGNPAFRVPAVVEIDGTRVVLVGRALASQLNFPTRTPEENAVYIGHPYVPGLYYPAASFHRDLYGHKVDELARLLVALGATSFQIELGRGGSMGKNIGAAINVEAVAIGAVVKRAIASKESLVFRARALGSQSPKLPHDLVWYPERQPEWKRFVEPRLRREIDEFSLEVSASEDYGITGQLSASVAKLGLTTGGTYEKQDELFSRVEATFPKISPEDGTSSE